MPLKLDVNHSEMPHIGKMMAARSIRKCKIRPSLYFLCLLIIAGTFCFFSKLDFTALRGFGFQIETIFVKVFNNDDFVLKTPGCEIVKYDPLDSRIAFYFKKLSPKRCPQNAEDVLIYAEDGRLNVHKKGRIDIVEASSQKFREKDVHFKCRKWTVYRHKIEENDDAYRISDNYTEFVDSTPIEDEYVRVKCFYTGHEIYHNYFYNIAKKPELEKELAVNEEKFLKQYPTCDQDRLSVLILGIDSVSKANFLRQFPRTHRLIMKNFSALDYLGYNKVGLNTYPCLMPLLMGLSTADVKNTCWGGGSNPFDNCTTLWDLFGAAGYRTAFVENLNNYGLFTYNKPGFRRQPAHYYGRTLYLPVMKNVGRFFDGCWRGMTDDEALAKWAVQFQRAFHDAPHFGHFWMSRLSHDDINTAQQIDPFLYNSIVKMAKDDRLNKTLLILMSDHGIRFGSFRETELGRLEENLPYLFLIFPEWFRQKYPSEMARLEMNRHRLVTTFDLHATLKSILHCEYNSPSFMAHNESLRDASVSLFQNISPNRTCDDAAIPAIYCACREDVLAQDVTSSESKMLGVLFVDALNNFTEGYRNICAKFAIKSIMSVKKVKPSGDTGKNSSVVRLENSYIVALVAEPGDAKFEATIQRVLASKTFVVNDDIRRINRYGNTSACISNDGFLKSICYCKIQNP